MRRALPGGYELDDDMARVDTDVVAGYLRDDSYWARGRSPETTERLVRDASRVVALYRGGETVGFCRIVSDDVTFAFLFDVFVLDDHRGHGLGVELVREAVENGPHRDLPWHLGTSDAHGLYGRFGFGAPDAERQMFRPGAKRM
jgi:GNAT superfamily N-acetyltransferase